MKQKILVTILVFTSMLALSACGSSSGSSSTAAPAPVIDIDSSKTQTTEPTENSSQMGKITEDVPVENIAIDNNIASDGGTSGLPYYEISFSPADFSFAG